MKNKILTTVLTSLFLYNTQLLHAFNQQNTLIKHALAWHEAGHALSFLYHPSSHLVHQVSIQPNISQKSLGHVYSIKTDNSEATIEELENVIISALAGGVAEQVYQQHNMLINLQDILKFFSQPQYCTDMHIVFMMLNEIIAKHPSYLTSQQKQQKIYDIITNLYQKSYQFIVQHKLEVQKMAQALLEKTILSSDETYELINIEKPLMSYQQAPLSAQNIRHLNQTGW